MCTERRIFHLSLLIKSRVRRSYGKLTFLTKSLARKLTTQIKAMESVECVQFLIYRIENVQSGRLSLLSHLIPSPSKTSFDNICETDTAKIFFLLKFWQY